jgi:hypothetical protein
MLSTMFVRKVEAAFRHHASGGPKPPSGRSLAPFAAEVTLDFAPKSASGLTFFAPG